MAKALLLNVLVDVLGEFVEGLTAENLKVGVFSGKIVLKNLQLNREGIEKLNLPLTVVKGYLELLEIKIPWTSLDSQPVRILIDGVYLLVSPFDKSKYDLVEEGQKLAKKKQNDLVRAEKKIELAAMLNSQAGEGKKKSNYFSNLAKKIVDNLEIKLCHIHIRYEDNTTFPGETFSCGCTLESFLVTTTDEKWSETFVNRASKGKDGSSMNFKLAKSSNFGVYWNIQSSEYGDLPYDAWKAVMKRCITDVRNNNKIMSVEAIKTTDPLEDNFTYIIQPSNYGQLKLIHDETPNVIPQLSIRFESSDLKLHCDKLQMRQSMKALFAMQAIQEKMHLLVHRPKQSALVAPWDWWYYVLMLMANKPDLMVNKATIAHLCCHHRPRYMELLKKHKLLHDKNPKAVMDTTEMNEIAVIESLLPLHALIVFRQLVIKEVILLQHRTQQEKQKAKPTRRMSSFFKSHFGSSKKKSFGGKDEEKEEVSVADEDDISVQALQHELEGVMQSAELDIDTLSLNFTAAISQTLHISSEWTPLIDINASFTLDGKIRPQEMSSTLAMTNLEVVDRVTEHAVLPNLLSWQLSSSPSTPTENIKSRSVSVALPASLADAPPVPFTLRIVKNVTCLQIQATSLPVEFCVNKPCVAALVELGMYVVDSDALKAKVDANLQNVVQLYEAGRRRALKRAYLIKQQLEAEAAAAALAGGSSSASGLHENATNNTDTTTSSYSAENIRIEVSVELHAPKLIIPQDCCDDSLGCLRLDMGHLSLQGLVSQGKTNTMRWTVAFTSMSADMPYAISDMYIGHIDDQLSEQSAACLRQVLDSRERVTFASPEIFPNYLVKPFGVVLDVKISDTASSVVNADVTVHPKIDAALDVDKLSRLLTLVQVLMSIVPTPPPTTLRPAHELHDNFMFKGKETTAKHGVSSSFATAEESTMEIPQYQLNKRKINRKTMKNNAKNRYDGDMDELTCLLELHVTLPCINLDLVYDNSTSLPSSVDVSLQQVVFTLMNRGYDMHLDFELGMILIKDSLRAKSQACIVRSFEHEVSTSVDSPGGESVSESGTGEKKEKDESLQRPLTLTDSHKLISISVQLIKNKRSPLYDPMTSCGCIIEAAFGQLFLLFDPNSFLHFRPFYEVLLMAKGTTGGSGNGKGKSEISQEFEGSAKQGGNDILLNQNVSDSSSVLNDASPSGVSFTLLFQELSLSLLQQNNYNYTRKIPLNQIFSFSFQDLTTDVQMASNSQRRAEINIRIISLFDTRDNSQNFYFKTVLRPMACIVHSCHGSHGGHLRDQYATAQLHQQQSVLSVDAKQDGFSDILQSEEEIEEEEGRYCGVMDLHGTTDQLSLLFEQSDAATQRISIILRSLCIYVSVDVLMEMVNTSVENVNAILQLVQPMDAFDTGDFEMQQQPQEDNTALNITKTVTNADTSEEQPQSSSPPLLMKSEPPLTNINLTVSVKIPNPQMIFLEDPTTEHSKAIVFRSNFDCTVTKCSDYSNNSGQDLENGGIYEDKDEGAMSLGSEDVTQAISVSVYDMEVFMLGDMALWQPHQILTPVRIETGISQTFTRGTLTTVSCCVNVDAIKLILSLNDIVLIQSILMRRSLSAPPSTTLERTPNNSSSNDDICKRKEATPLFLVKAVFNMRTTTFTLVNDFHGYNTPILQVQLDETAFKLDGFIQDMIGSGFVTIKVDYYNPLIVEWEPLLETWQPEIEIKSNSQEINVSAVTHQTLQLNVTSTFLETLSSTYAMLVTQNEFVNTTSRQLSPTITFSNQLGVAVSLLDSHSHDCLFHLDPRSATTESRGSEVKDKVDFSSASSVGIQGNLFVGKATHSAFRMQSQHGDILCAMVTEYPDFIDVHIDDSTFVTDQSVLSRLGTTQIRTTTACPVVELPLCQLQAALVASSEDESFPSTQTNSGFEQHDETTLPGQTKTELEMQAAKQPIKQERVEVETFEYERYNPMLFSKGWTEPFLPMDPHKFSDKVHNDSKRPLHSFHLPSSGSWEWETPWTVDLKTGVIGKSIDENGWSYAFDFSDLFNTDIPPRGRNQAMDCVRRRRWVRTRVRDVILPPIEPHINTTTINNDSNLSYSKNPVVDDTTPHKCMIIWEVAVKDNGQKVITLRAPLVIQNTLPYEVKISLQDGTVLGPIAENENLAIPLQKMKFAQYVQVQPTRFTKEWSECISCQTRSVDYTEQLDVSVSMTSNADTKKPSKHETLTLPIRSLVCQIKDSMTLTLYSHVEIINALPCAMHFKLAKSYKDLKNQNIIDQKVMNAGDGSKLYFVNIKETNFISLSLPGPYGWSDPVDIKQMVDKKGRVNVVFKALSSSSAELANQDIALLVRLQVQIKVGAISTIEVFSNSAFVDYTGLDIAISSVVNKKTGEKIKRVSYSQIEEISTYSCGNNTFGLKESNASSESGDGLISNLMVKSNLKYEAVSNATPGMNVHTDRDYQFSYLPPFLQNQSYICTAGDDRQQLVEGSSFLQFQVDSERETSRDLLVIILIDIRVTKLPPWLKTESFHLLRGERVVAIGKSFSNQSIELNYKLYGKSYSSGDIVSLGCNYSSDARNMYSIFVLPSYCGISCDGSAVSLASEVLEQVQHSSQCAENTTGTDIYSTKLADVSWVAGGRGCTLFNTETGRVTVGVKRGKIWSKQEINLRGLDSTSRKNGPFEVVDKENGIIYQLVYTVHFLPSLFSRTKILTVMPRYCIVNCLQVPVYIRQYDNNYTLADDWGSECDLSEHPHVTAAKQFRTTGWHQLQKELDTKVQIRLSDTCWCWGYFDINEIGSSQVLLVKHNRKEKKMSNDVSGAVDTKRDLDEDDFDVIEADENDDGEDDFQPPIVVNVDIKLASSTDKCAVSIVFWSSTEAKASDLCITNHSKYAITVTQEDVINEIKKTVKKYPSLASTSSAKSLSASKTSKKEETLLVRQKQHVLHIPPNVTIPFGYAFPGNKSKKKKIFVGLFKDSSTAFSTKEKTVVDLRIGGSQDGVKLYFPKQSLGSAGSGGNAVKEKEKAFGEFRATVSVELHSHGREIKIVGNNHLSERAREEDAKLLNNIPHERSLRSWTCRSLSMMSENRSSSVAELNAALLHGPVSDDQSGSVDECSISPPQEVIHISAAPKESSRELNLSFEIASIGVSIVADRPKRRELLSVYLNDIKQNVSKIDHILSLELSVQDMQIDNYSETAIYPVLFRKMPTDERTAKSTDNSNDKKDEVVKNIPFVQIALLQEQAIDTGTITFKYLTARILEFAVEVDSGSILLLLTDVLGKVNFLTPDQALSFANPQAWITQYNRQITSPIVTRELTNVYEAQCLTQTSRILFEQLILHPMKVSLTFMQTDLPTGRVETLTSSNVLETLVSIASVNSMELRLNSFIVNNVVESVSSLQARILAKTIHDITGQLALIVGSLEVIGNPANLVSNIGNGVQDFFYEPYQGLVQSPVAFIQGVHKGTTSLVSGILSGSLTSAAALVGTASNGFSYLSGDQDFVRKRATQRQKQQATRGGALTGIKDGGESFITGIASGISGIVMKPIEGAKEEGALGFFKGVGKGIVGVAVKPVLGVTDGITSIVEGISNEVGKVNTDGYLQLRPKRTFQKSTQNPNMFVLCGVNLEAAEGQEFALKYSRKKQLPTDDFFLNMITIDGQSDIIVTEYFIHHRRESEQQQKNSKQNQTRTLPADRKCVSVPWTSVAYALLLEGNTFSSQTGSTDIGVEVSVFSKDNKKTAIPWYIPCKSLSTAQLVYELFIQNKDKMSNADLMRDASAKPLVRGKNQLLNRTTSTSTYAFSAATTTNIVDSETFGKDLNLYLTSGDKGDVGSDCGIGESALQRGQTTVQTSEYTPFKYTYGTANNFDISDDASEDEKAKTEMALLIKTQQRIYSGVYSNYDKSDSDAAEHILDQAIWWAIFKWHHFGFSRVSNASSSTNVSAATTAVGNGSAGSVSAAVCCCALLLNKSKRVLYLRRADVVLGKGVWILCGTTVSDATSISTAPTTFAPDNSNGCNPSLSHSHDNSVIAIPAGGYAFTFATAAAASTYESGNLEVTLYFSSSSSATTRLSRDQSNSSSRSIDRDESCAFEWNMSNQLARCKIFNEYKYTNNHTEAPNRYRVEFLEKTVAQTWSKFVVLVTDVDNHL